MMNFAIGVSELHRCKNDFSFTVFVQTFENGKHNKSTGIVRNQELKRKRKGRILLNRM